MDSVNREYERKKTIRYFADAAMCISKNVAIPVNGQYVGKHFADILEPPEEDNRSAEEIIADMRAKLRDMGGEDDICTE